MKHDGASVPRTKRSGSHRGRDRRQVD